MPDSSNTAALGYQRECARLGFRCAYEFGIIRNHYVGTRSTRASLFVVGLRWRVARCYFALISEQLPLFLRRFGSDTRLDLHFPPASASAGAQAGRSSAPGRTSAS